VTSRSEQAALVAGQHASKNRERARSVLSLRGSAGNAHVTRRSNFYGPSGFLPTMVRMGLVSLDILLLSFGF
jgi:hypothetical protein